MWLAMFLRFALIVLLAVCGILPSIIGLLVTGLGSLVRNWGTATSVHYPGRINPQWKQRVFWLWSNDEDGVVGPAWYNPAQSRWKAFCWSGLRNSAANLRWVWPYGFTVIPAKVRYIGNSKDVEQDYADGRKGRYWHLAWHTMFAGFRGIFPVSNKIVQCLSLVLRRQIPAKSINICIGYRLLPRDANGIPKDDPRQGMANLTSQVHLINA